MVTTLSDAADALEHHQKNRECSLNMTPLTLLQLEKPPRRIQLTSPPKQRRPNTTTHTNHHHVSSTLALRHHTASSQLSWSSLMLYSSSRLAQPRFLHFYTYLRAHSQHAALGANKVPPYQQPTSLNLRGMIIFYLSRVSLWQQASFPTLFRPSKTFH